MTKKCNGACLIFSLVFYIIEPLGDARPGHTVLTDKSPLTPAHNQAGSECEQHLLCLQNYAECCRSSGYITLHNNLGSLLYNCYFPMGGIEVGARTGELENRDEL